MEKIFRVVTIERSGETMYITLDFDDVDKTGRDLNSAISRWLFSRWYLKIHVMKFTKKSLSGGSAAIGSSMMS
jgi:hypothetical protein